MKRLIGKNIKKYRNIKGFTQAFVSKELGYKSSSTICEIENGKKGVDADNVPRIAKILCVNIENLFDDEDDNHILRKGNSS
ncbi:MAG TPA: helix-turn-helix transcriptional regulator [Bacillus bacterium]|nr:helix-turn-helix transcriptional regulator [Bacillus sp. (in: firmicutes)]